MTFNPDIHSRESIRVQEYDYSQPGYYFVTICIREMDQDFGKIMNNKMILSALGKAAENCWNEIPAHFPHVRLDEYIIMPNHIHGIFEFTRFPDHNKPINNVIDANQRVQNAGGLVQNVGGCVQNVDGCVQNVDGCVQNVGGCVQNVDGCIQNVDGCVQNVGGCVQNVGGCVQNVDGCVQNVDGCVQNVDGCFQNVGVQNFEPLHFEHIQCESRQTSNESRNTHFENVKSINNDENNKPAEYRTNHIYPYEEIRINRFQKIIPGSLGSVIRGFKIGVTKWCKQNQCEDFRWQRNFYDEIIKDEEHLENVRNYIRNNPMNWQSND